MSSKTTKKKKEEKRVELCPHYENLWLIMTLLNASTVGSERFNTCTSWRV